METYSCSHLIFHLAWVTCPLSVLVYPPLPRQGLYPFPRPAVTKCHNLVVLNQQKCILSHFWRPEIQSQDLGRAMFPLKLWVKSCLPSSQLLVVLLANVGISWCTSSSSTSASITTWHSPFMCVCVSSYEDTSHTGLRAYHSPMWPQLNLANYMFSNQLTLWDTGG